MKRYILIWVLGCIPMLLSAQAYLQIMEELNTTHFQTIVDAVEHYYADNKDGINKREYKHFYRWKKRHEHRLDENGHVQNYAARTLLAATATLQKMEKINTCVWEPIAPLDHSLAAHGYSGGLGRVNCVAVDPDEEKTIYIGAPAGGLWRTTTGGTASPGDPPAWTALTDFLPQTGVSAVVIDPNSSVGNRTLYILTGDGDGGDTPSIGVLKSTDNGDTWTSTGLSFGLTPLRRAYAMIIHPDNSDILLACVNRRVYRTDDGGVSWTVTLSPAADLTDIEFHPDDPNIVYAVDDDGDFWRSSDNGLNWANTFSVANVRRMEIAVSAGAADNVYMVTADATSPAGEFRGFFLSTNSGNNFNLVSNTPNILGWNQSGNDEGNQGWYDLAIEVSPSASTILVGGINVWRSVDNGANWSVTSRWDEDNAGPGNYTHADIHVLAQAHGSIFCGSDGGIYRTDNNGGDWVDIGYGLQIAQVYHLDACDPGECSFDPDYNLVYGAQDNGVNGVVDPTTLSEVEQLYGADGFETVIMNNSNNSYIAGMIQFGDLKNTSSGSSIGVPYATGSGNANWDTPYFITTLNGAFAEIFVAHEDVWSRHSNLTGGWTNRSNGAIGTGRKDQIQVYGGVNSDYDIFALDGAELWRSTDGGTTWNNISPGFSMTSFDVNPADRDNIYVSRGGFTDGEKVYETTDGGATWTNISDGLPNVPANCLLLADGLYVGMDMGVFYMDETLDQWVPFNTGLPNTEVTELDHFLTTATTGFIYASTYGRGIWRAPFYSQCAGCAGCPQLTDVHAVSRSFEAEVCILSDAWVYDDVTIEYQAGEHILLSEGFLASGHADSDFWGHIEECLEPEYVKPKMKDPADQLAALFAAPEEAPEDRKLEEPDPQFEFSAKVFPNPAQDWLEVDVLLPEVFEGGRLVINDVKGQLVLQRNLLPAEGYRVYVPLDVSSLEAGIYYVSLIDERSARALGNFIKTE